MLLGSGKLIRILSLTIALFAAAMAYALAAASWSGVLTDESGKPISGAVVHLHSTLGRDFTATTEANGQFIFAELAAGSYEISVAVTNQTWNAATAIVVKDGTELTLALQLSPANMLRVVAATTTQANTASPKASGGEHLSS